MRLKSGVVTGWNVSGMNLVGYLRNENGRQRHPRGYLTFKLGVKEHKLLLVPNSHFFVQRCFEFWKGIDCLNFRRAVNTINTRNISLTNQAKIIAAVVKTVCQTAKRGG